MITAPNFIKPGFKHEHAPDTASEIARAGEMPSPCASDRMRIEVTLRFQPAELEQILRPFADRTTKPLPDGNAEALLWPFNEMFRYIAVEHIPQDGLGLFAAFER